MKRMLLLLALLLMTGVSWAKDALPMAENEAVEKRMTAIAEELRCLVCQNESLAGSRAELAEDLRREVRKLIVAGKTDAEIKEFLVSRYGDFVLYRPPVKPTTWVLWIGPFVLLLAGVGALIALLRRRTRTAETALTEGEARRAEELLKDAET